MPYKYCQHVRENGLLCKSPAMKQRAYCYYHTRARLRRLALAKAQAENKRWRLEMPPLEDMYAVQSAISNVVEALASEAIDKKTAALILYGLQQASNNVRDMRPWVGSSRFQVSELDDRRLEMYSGLEAEFGLPKSTDLDAAPEVAYPPPPQPYPVTVLPPKKLPGNVLSLRALEDLLADTERSLADKSS